MTQERDAIAIRGIPIDVSALANGQVLIYNSTTRVWTLTTGLNGTKVYYVSDTSAGAVTRKITFTNGLLTAET